MAQQAGPVSSNAQNQNHYTPNLRQKFGEIGAFWDRYDKLADDHDQRLIKNLNDNLDVLLIFAALFSAVNASIIQMATPSLSPDQSAETNYLLRILITKADNTTFGSEPQPPSQSKDPRLIAANCLLYSSLCCSILASVGAILAKEWLQNFERSGQVGPLQDQALLRQRKFNGVRKWNLEPIIRFLPTLLLLSVVLFFAGLTEFLFPVDPTAARVVMAFAIFGGILYLVSTFAAIVWTACPYKTSVSKGIGYLIQDIVLPSAKRASRWLARRFAPQEPSTESVKLQVPLEANRDAEILNAQAACWLLETTSSFEDQQMIIQNLISLTPGAFHFLIHNSEIFQRLLLLAVNTIRTLHDQSGGQTVAPAQHFSTALLHMCVGSPKESKIWNMVKEHLSAHVRAKAGKHRQGPTEPFYGCLELCLCEPVTTLPANPASIFPLNDYSMKVVMLSMIALGDIPFWNLDQDQAGAWSALSHLFGDKYDDTILTLVALAISREFSNPKLQPDSMITLVQRPCSGKDTLALLTEGIRCGFIAITGTKCPPYTFALPILTEILKRLAELPSKEALTEPQSGAMLLDVARLILAVNNTDDKALSNRALTAARSEFMAGALGFLRTCSPPVKEGDFTASLFDAALVAFIRSSKSSTSSLGMETLDWLALCLNKNDFVADQTISNLMWGLKTMESTEETLQLIYTYMSKWFKDVGQHRYKKWISDGLIDRLLDALPGGTTTGEMNLRIPLTLRHVIKRAIECSWEVQGAEEIMMVGLNVVNSINTEKGTVGQAYSLLIFEVLLDIWKTIPADKRAKQMSERMDLATMRMLMETEALLDPPSNAAPANQPPASPQSPTSPVNQAPATTAKQLPANGLTAAIGPKIAVMVNFERFNLTPVVLREFLSELRGKKAEPPTSSATA